MNILTWATVWSVVKPVLKVVAILAAGHLLIRYAVKLLQKGLDKTKLDQSLVRMLCRAINVALHLLAVLSALNSVGVSTGGIVAALSAAALAVTVALKDSLSNVAGGILLLLSPRFATGDYIEAGGSGGTVQEVSLLHTTLLTVDRKQISIPNGVLINGHIINYSREHRRQVSQTFRLPYEADAALAQRLVLEVLEAHPLAQTEPDPPFVRVTGYDENYVQLSMRVWCTNEDYWSLHFDLLEQIRAAFEAYGIFFPHTQLDVHLHQEAPAEEGTNA